MDQEESYAYNGASLFTQAFLATARGQINRPPDGIVSLDDLISGINRLLDAKRKELGIKMTPHLYQERIERNEGQFFFLPNSMQRTGESNTAVSAFQGKNAVPLFPGSRAAPQVKSTSVPRPLNSQLSALNRPAGGGYSMSPAHVASQQPSGALGPNGEFRDCPECPEMVAIKPGSFQMGSPTSEQRRDFLAGVLGVWANEGPVHEVHINYAFAVSKYPTTRAEWKRFVSAANHSDNSDCLNGQQDDHPVVCVSWQDARDYAAWLTKISRGQHYRLLSEAEYEYVNRAGTQSAYWWGESFSSSHANNSSGTKPVTSFPPNPWRLYDTTGNAYSWTLDCYHRRYDNAPNDGRAWDEGETCSGGHVIRGGTWGQEAAGLRSAARDSGRIFPRYIGFRVARTAD